MCMPKSAIVLKDRVYVPDHDHHTQMLEELKIADTRENAENLFVRVELSPQDGDMFSDIETWQLDVDQDMRPDWFFEELELPKIRAAVVAWAKKHIFIGVDNLELPAGCTYYLKNCKRATLRDNSTATLWGNSTATLWENSTATLWDNSTATLRGNSTATLRGNSTATLRGNSTATLWDNSTATLRGNSTATLWENSIGIMPDCYYPAKRDNFILMDNSTLKDCTAQTIYQSGGWKLVAVNV